MSTTASCTFGGHTYYNNGWNWSSFSTSTGYGWPGYGKDTNGNNRVIVLKFTTPSFSNATNKQIQVGIPLYRDASGTDTWYYRVSTSAPSFSESGGTAVTLPSSYIASGSLSLSTSTSYTFKTITTGTADFQASTTYYIWFWSDTPTGSTIGYYGNSTSAGGTISVSLVYDEVTYSYYAPGVALDGYSGFYGGATLYVENNESYPYIYVGNSASGTYWRKATSGTSISIDADTSSTSKTIYVIRVNEDAGSSFSYSGSTYRTYNVPRYACGVYNASSSCTRYYSGADVALSYSGYTLKGLNTSASVYETVTYSPGSTVLSNDNVPQCNSTTNGNVYYAVYTQSKSITYYRGSSDSYSASATSYLYGKGSTSSGTISEPTTRTCLSNSSYSFQGWARSSSSTTVYYDYLDDAYNSGYTTVYGVYINLGSSTSSTVYYYRGSSSKQSVTKTTTTDDAYYYGKGSHTGGDETYSYGSITSTCAADSSASLLGWATSSSTTSYSYASATEAFDDGYATIYGVYKKASTSTDSTVYYYRGTSTKNSVTKTTKVADKYYYGKGSTSDGDTTYSYGTINTSCGVSGWTLLGFTTSSTTQSATASATSLFDAGNTTIYGTYSLTETMTYYPQNGESSGSASVTNYRYGTGSVTTNRPTEPTLSKNNCTQLGWGTSADSDVSTWIALWDAGTRTVYAIWKQDNQIYFGVNGVWVPVSLYYGVNGEWKPSIVRYGASEWK